MTPRLLPIALLLGGFWLGLLVASWVAATVNFRSVDHVLGPGGSREAQALFETVRAEDRRVLLRHLASEINRWMFRWWSLAQVALALTLLGLLWRQGGDLRWLAVAALAIVVVQVVGLAAPITEIGRAIDFLPRPLPADLGRRFGLLHGAFVLLDLGKAGTLLAILGLALRRA
ncbi:MAG TPA: hypothetical protein VI669_01230 [Vicinamibacteria bacterium]